jgi:hypothetical protein
MQQVRDDVANGPFGGRRGVELKRENRGVSLSLLATVGEADMVGMATLAQIEADRTVDALLAAVLRLDDRRIDDRPLEQEFQAVALKDLVAGLDLLILVVDLDSRRPAAMIGRRDNDADPMRGGLSFPPNPFPVTAPSSRTGRRSYLCAGESRNPFHSLPECGRSCNAGSPRIYPARRRR